MMPAAPEASQRIARITAHLNPPNLLMVESCGLIRPNCRARAEAAGFKVAILGAAGGIGQPLAILMKINPSVSVLHLCDVVNTSGVTVGISHMDTGAVAEVLGLYPREVDVPVIGGHAGVTNTIFPLLSQEAEPNDRKIGKLCDYASKNPLRIPKITDTLEQRFYKELQHENFGYVKVVVCIYRKLLSSCKEHM